VGVVIRLAPDRGFSGRILGAEEGDPFNAGVVELQRVDESGQPRWCDSGKVEPDGRYRFSGLWPGEWAVTARVDGRTLKGRVKLRPGAEAHLDLSLPPKLALHGQVVNEEGQPIAGAKVELRQDGMESGGMSAADGTFVVRVNSGGTWTATAERTGFTPTSGELVEIAAPTPRAIKLVMTQGAVLRMHIGKGQVVQSLWASGRSQPFRLPGEDDADGGYRISGLPPGVWTVTAKLSQPAAQITKHVLLGPETRELTVDLSVPQGGLTFSGNLGWVSTIVLKRLGDPEVEFSTAPAVDETFHFSGLPAGSYLLEFDTGRGYRVIKGEVELAAGGQVVRHLRDGELEIPGVIFPDDR
jgi:hypothetical protein